MNVKQWAIVRSVGIAGRATPWRVGTITGKTITIFNPDARSPKFAGKRYRYTWDGIGYKRQGEYLTYLP
jgi:hypothetical protein